VEPGLELSEEEDGAGAGAEEEDGAGASVEESAEVESALEEVAESVGTGVGRGLHLLTRLELPLTERFRFARASCPRRPSLTAWGLLRERALTGSAPEEQAKMAKLVIARRLRSLFAIIRQSESEKKKE
jgi:hypothetical protein